MEDTEAADLHTHGKKKRRIYRERRFGVIRVILSSAWCVIPVLLIMVPARRRVLRRR
jgi:hypothetical protein